VREVVSVGGLVELFFVGLPVFAHCGCFSYNAVFVALSDDAVLLVFLFRFIGFVSNGVGAFHLNSAAGVW